MLTFFACLIFIPLFLFLAFLYFKNIMKLIGSIKNEDWSIKTILRSVGVFIPLVGVIMGAV